MSEGSTMSAVVIASRSARGARPRNEDCLRHGRFDGGWYAVLSDGAGGHRDGARASGVVVTTIADGLEVVQARHAAAPSSLADLVRAADAALNALQANAAGRERMHATVVLLRIAQDTWQAQWSHVGDSRLYLLRGGRVLRATRDDSVVQALVDAGLLAPDDARDHAARHQLVAALGVEHGCEPHVSAGDFVARDGDAFLLCSDGWHDRLEAADIERCLRGALTAQAWLDAMQALVLERQDGDQDNFSAIAVWIGSVGESTRALP